MYSNINKLFDFIDLQAPLEIFHMILGEMKSHY
jgi:hypothetical protein